MKTIIIAVAILALSFSSAQAYTIEVDNLIRLDNPRELPERPIKPILPCRKDKCKETTETTPVVIKAVGNSSSCDGQYFEEALWQYFGKVKPCWTDMQKAIIELNK